MSGETVSGINLLDGPFGPFKNAYPLDWPLPEQIVAFKLDGRIAITTADNLQRAMEISNGEAYLYRKVSESDLPDEAVAHPNIFRGANFEYVNGED